MCDGDIIPMRLLPPSIQNTDKSANANIAPIEKIGVMFAFFVYCKLTPRLDLLNAPPAVCLPYQHPAGAGPADAYASGMTELPARISGL